MAKNYDAIMDEYVYDKLLKIFNKYPTSIQDTILHIISIRLRELYASIDEFPKDVLNPGKEHYDMLLAKAEQFDYDINGKYSLSEQIALLNSIYNTYSKRGSIDSIENMWKYYGGNLPKEVTVTIPAYEIFRYSVSALSGTHRFQDNLYYRSGVYTINIEGSYNIDDIRDFIVKELVAAGTSVNFHRINPLDFSSGNAAMKSDTVYQSTTIYMDLTAALNRTGLTWSVHSPKMTWSGSSNLLVSITVLIDLEMDMAFYMLAERGLKYDYTKSIYTYIPMAHTHNKRTEIISDATVYFDTLVYADPHICTYMDIMTKMLIGRIYGGDHYYNIDYARLLLNDNVLTSSTYKVSIPALANYLTKAYPEVSIFEWLGIAPTVFLTMIPGDTNVHKDKLTMGKFNIPFEFTQDEYRIMDIYAKSAYELYVSDLVRNYLGKVNLNTINPQASDTSWDRLFLASLPTMISAKDCTEMLLDLTVEGCGHLLEINQNIAQMLDKVSIDTILPWDLKSNTLFIYYADVSSDGFLEDNTNKLIINDLSYSLYSKELYVSEHYYDRNHEEILPDDTYPAIFILGKTLLGTTIPRSEN